jgi:GNAT superfamily N-acetyltransferase
MPSGLTRTAPLTRTGRVRRNASNGGDVPGGKRHDAHKAARTAGGWTGRQLSRRYLHDQDARPPGRPKLGDAMNAAAAAMQFTDIGPDDSRLTADILPVLRELRPHLTAETLASIYNEGYPQGLRFTGAYVDGACLGVAGWRIVATTFCGRKLTIDDIVTTATARSHGLGRAVLAELHRRARAADCHLLDLDSATPRADAHRFYMREHMSIGAFHFIAQL